MSHVVSLRLRDEQMERMRRLARRMSRTVSEASALLLEEALRMAEFAFIQFRDSPAGRQAYIQGSSLAVWEVAALAQACGGDADKVAVYLEWPETKVRAALNYADAYPDEIAAAIEDNRLDLEGLRRMVPEIEVFVAGDGPDDVTDARSSADGGA